MNTKDALNKEVLDSNAERVGKVVDLIFELPPGNISHIVVKTGMTKKMEMPVSLISKTGDSIILNVPKEVLESRTS